MRKFIFNIMLESEEFGSDKLSTYETMPEALDAVKRVANTSLECFHEDGIERKISIVIAEPEEQD